VIHIRSRQCVQTNITSGSFRQRMSFSYLSNMIYQLSFISMYPCKQTNKIGPTYSKSLDRGDPLQLYAMHLYAAGFSLNLKYKLAVTHFILTWSSLYNLQHFPLLFVIIFLRCLQQKVMAPETIPTDEIGAESSRTTGTSRNAPLGQTQLQCRPQ